MATRERPAAAGFFNPRGGQRRGFHVAVGLALAVFLALPVWLGAPGPAPASVPKERLLEDLKFRVEYLLWKDVARAQLTLKSLGPGHYRAEISGEPRGLLKLLVGNRRDTYQTEMITRQGKLMPLVYREESNKRGHRALKEYRFDYDRGRLELWQLKEGRGLVNKWHTKLRGPVYDPLTAFYNCRLGLMGPIRDGETFKVNGIPYPQPEEIEVRIGPETKAGRQIMITIANKAFNQDRGVVFAYFDGGRVPQQAWTDTRMGKVWGELLTGGQRLQGDLPGLAGSSKSSDSPRTKKSFPVPLDFPGNDDY